MPPKAKFTRDEIILAALQIVREQGLSAVTARALAKQLGSSACPVFTVFKNMEEVNAEIIRYAKNLYKTYVQEGLKQEKAFRGAGSAYIRFAIKEPKLFQILFMSEQTAPTDVEHTLKFIDESYEDILGAVKNEYGLSDEESVRLYKHLWIYTHGIATMCATKVCVFEAEEIQAMMAEIVKSLLNKIKRGQEDDKN